MESRLFCIIIPGLLIEPPQKRTKESNTNLKKKKDYSENCHLFTVPYSLQIYSDSLGG